MSVSSVRRANAIPSQRHSLTRKAISAKFQASQLPQAAVAVLFLTLRKGKGKGIPMAEISTGRSIMHIARRCMRLPQIVRTRRGWKCLTRHWKISWTYFLLTSTVSASDVRDMRCPIWLVTITTLSVDVTAANELTSSSSTAVFSRIRKK